MNNRTNSFHFLVVLIISGTLAHAASDTTKHQIIPIHPDKITFTHKGPLPKTVKEASGLIFTAPHHLWSHNDDGIPALYCMDTLGQLVRAVQLNCINNGWEDLARDEAGNVYIGSFGNNRNDKKDLKIYKIHDPQRIDALVTQPEIIHFRYADQKAFPPPKASMNFDADAFIAWQGALYIFTKNRTIPFSGYSKVYKLSQDPGHHIAVPVDSIFVGHGSMLDNWVTGADISPDKKTLALLFHDHILLIRHFENKKFSEGRIYKIELNHYSHKAGISFFGNERLFIVDELEFNLIGGQLYSVDLKPLYNVLDQ